MSSGPLTLGLGVQGPGPVVFDDSPGEQNGQSLIDSLAACVANRFYKEAGALKAAFKGESKEVRVSVEAGHDGWLLIRVTNPHERVLKSRIHFEDSSNVQMGSF